MTQSTNNWIEDDGSKEVTRAAAVSGIGKPGRYIGGELNSVVKPGVRPAIALAFPDIYEIGMSHFGLKILYDSVNRDPRFAAERVFAPWTDKAIEIRESGGVLRSLETGKPLRDFELIGFSVSYELSYPDMLEMLELGGVKIRAADRLDDDPIVIAGGHSALHMAPMQPFLDGVFLGEGDDAMIELLEVFLPAPHSGVPDKSAPYGRAGPTGRSREEKLSALSRVEGMYVYGYSSRQATRRIFYGFADSRGVENQIVPNITAVHDRVTVEIMRGCTRGCRFCQAGYITRPQRYRSVEAIVENTMSALEKTGHDEVSLISLSSCDHPAIMPIASALYERLAPRHISISIPSTRVDAFDVAINNMTGSGRRTGITLAPEVGSERMDRIINKGSPRPKLIQSVHDAFDNGWKSVKLYYLIGLPFETLEDARAIGEVLAELAPIARKKRGEIHASVSIFCPKPWTPFQWSGMESTESLREKIAAIRKATPRSVKLDIHDAKSSLVESALARGGKELGDVIETAWRSGATLQAWGEKFGMALWQEAFRKHGSSLEEEAARVYSFEESLPWESINIGVDRDFLLREWRAAERAALGEGKFQTDDCSTGKCSNCGMPCVGTHPTFDPQDVAGLPGRSVAGAREGAGATSDEGFIDHHKESRAESDGECDTEQNADQEARAALDDVLPDEPSRLAFHFSRNGASSLVGHLDFIRIFERAVRRARICGAMTQGFNPRLRLRLAQPLPLGVEAEYEYAEIDLYSTQPQDFIERMNRALPESIRIIDALVIAPGKMPLPKAFRYRVETLHALGAGAIITGKLEQNVDRRRKDKVIQVRLGDFLDELEVNGSSLAFRLHQKEQGSLSINDVLELLRPTDSAVRAVRVAMEI